MLLHYLDQMDAKMNLAYTLAQASPEEGSAWSAYERTLGTQLLVPNLLSSEEEADLHLAGPGLREGQKDRPAPKPARRKRTTSTESLPTTLDLFRK